MNCPSCKKKNTLRPWEGPITIMGVELVARGQRCSSCGEGLYAGDEVQRQEALVAEAIVARGIRTGEEFVFVRKTADLAAADIARLFGVRPETVWRWEHDEHEIPRTAAFALAQLYKAPKQTRESFEVLVS
jgi:DNA-binding transcriptional regulator YiaG